LAAAEDVKGLDHGYLSAQEDGGAIDRRAMLGPSHLQ